LREGRESLLEASVAVKVEGTVGKYNLEIECGEVARQANGAAIVRYGDTVVLTAAVCSEPREDIDFFPLLVEYREMTYAAGKFPGGFYKREGKPSLKETLTMRLIDRPLRPLFPEGYKDEVQIVSIVLSADKENDPDVLAIIGASTALTVSDIPFNGPIGAVRVGRLNGKYVLQPSIQELDESDIDLVVAGTDEGVVMVEGGAREVPEADIVGAIEFAHAAIKEIVALQRDLREQCGKPKKSFEVNERVKQLAEELKPKIRDELLRICEIRGKKEREKAVDELRERVMEELCTDAPDAPTRSEVASAFDAVDREIVREIILSGKRVDGRSHTEVRPINCKVGVLPRTHGSSIFTRGETQALVVATLGTAEDEQKVDGLIEEYSKKFMLHYNFPPFCVGEVKPIRGPSRRDLGHGALAERCIEPVLPSEEEFPYTIRVVSDILESNGSSSMATVCGASLCLMDAGVPIKAPVAGIAMGLVKEGDKVCILTDILGVEDKYGDMDFKVAATEKGITGLQMDIKVSGISYEIMSRALEQAKEARKIVLGKMLATIDRPRAEISKHAPRLTVIKIDREKIGALIGPGGKTVKKIQDDTGTEIEIQEDGTVFISAPSEEATEEAKKMIQSITAEAKVGDIYTGRVVAIKDFGAFVEIFPGQDGLVHISELSDGYVRSVSDVVKVGDEIKVKVIAIDDQGRIKLSRKEALRDSSRTKS